MDRRTALKNISLGFGYALTTPVIMGILESCSEKKDTWSTLFLSEEQKTMVSQLSDIILPKSDIPGANDVNVPQFIDKVLNQVATQPQQDIFNKGSQIFSNQFQSMFGKKILKSDRDEIETLFESLFKLEQDEQKKIQNLIQLEESNLVTDLKVQYLLYKFLFNVRELTLLGYFTSEKVGKEVLNFDPIPVQYEPCIPLSDVGNSWTI